ncbi:ABC transporter ATP-binding protein [Thermosphaera aggregans]|uniref:ABC transporter related protein n=1 Tax=Thermosphaera aggregans (strain DSM 11486 / M11TL) TaxID=633148 RepID=D5U1C0_THEAM|nr:ABC transporter related protein [Thermosphaera aggregans DSM 11486]
MIKPLLEVRNIRKTYGRKILAVDNLSFNVMEGEIYGLIGPNGAGKTTSLRIIAGLIKPDAGEVLMQGVNVHENLKNNRKIIGYLPEEANTYPLLTGMEHLKIYGGLYGASEEDLEFGAKITGLGSRLFEKTSGYSHGMKRRLLLGAVLMTKPRLAILDEPTSGLDVHASVSVRKTIRDYVKTTGAAAIVSSHNMLEIEYLCDRIGLIFKGRIVEEGRPRELIEKYGVANLEEVFTLLVKGVES